MMSSDNFFHNLFKLNLESFIPTHSLDLQGWLEEPEFMEEIIRIVKPGIIIEVGTWKGKSAIAMANKTRSLGLNSKIYCVDTWLGALEFWTTHFEKDGRNLEFRNGMPQVYNQFLSNVVHTGNQDIIFPLPCTSKIASKIFQYYNICADLIYIDASHEEDDVFSDITAYSRIINTNGVIFGDDYNNGAFPGVKKAVHRFASENQEFNLYISEGKRYLLITKNKWL